VFSHHDGAHLRASTSAPRIGVSWMTTSNIARGHENPAACMHAGSLTRQDLERRSPGLRTLRLHVANVAPQGCHRELRSSLRGRHLHGCARQHLLVCRCRRLHWLLLELRRVRHLLRPAVPGEQGKGIWKRASAHGRWVHAGSIARRCWRGTGASLTRSTAARRSSAAACTGTPAHAPSVRTSATPIWYYREPYHNAAFK